tara:strand:+ start:103 stop:648 length:546 start_codon:yes stop_codon:yes gene_type:complete
VCLRDKNKALRRQALAEDTKRKFDFGNEQLAYRGSEVSYELGEDANVMGFSRDSGDTYYNVLSVLGKGREAKAKSAVDYAIKQYVDEGGGSKSAGRNTLIAMLNQNKDIENTVLGVLGPGQAINNQKNIRKYQASKAKNRSKLKTMPQFGPPTIMPGKDTGGILGVAEWGLGIATGIKGLR